MTMHPMRVEWVAPDGARRLAAFKEVERDREGMHQASRTGGGDADLELLRRSLAGVRTDAEIERVWHARYPDLGATVTHYGTLLSVRYVPAQHGVTSDQKSGRVTKHELSPAKWVALVATADGTVEMDPTKLRVMWPMSAGDPIGGIVEHDERARNQARQSKE
jgi:hypothetical protein